MRHWGHSGISGRSSSIPFGALGCPLACYFWQVGRPGASSEGWGAPLFLACCTCASVWALRLRYPLCLRVMVGSWRVVLLSPTWLACWPFCMLVKFVPSVVSSRLATSCAALNIVIGLSTKTSSSTTTTTNYRGLFQTVSTIVGKKAAILHNKLDYFTRFGYSGSWI